MYDTLLELGQFYLVCICCLLITIICVYLNICQCVFFMANKRFSFFLPHSHAAGLQHPGCPTLLPGEPVLCPAAWGCGAGDTGGTGAGTPQAGWALADIAHGYWIPREDLYEPRIFGCSRSGLLGCLGIPSSLGIHVWYQGGDGPGQAQAGWALADITYFTYLLMVVRRVQRWRSVLRLFFSGGPSDDLSVRCVMHRDVHTPGSGSHPRLCRY